MLCSARMPTEYPNSLSGSHFCCATEVCTRKAAYVNGSGTIFTGANRWGFCTQCSGLCTPSPAGVNAVSAVLRHFVSLNPPSRAARASTVLTLPKFAMHCTTAPLSPAKARALLSSDETYTPAPRSPSLDALKPLSVIFFAFDCVVPWKVVCVGPGAMPRDDQ